MKTEHLEESTGCVVPAFNNFGIRLLDALAGDDPQKNVLLSPVSIAFPFAMLLGGAGGKTAEALRKTLGLGDLPLEDLDRECNALLAALRDPDPRTALAAANGLWVQEGVGVAEGFARRLRDSYEAEIANLDFKSAEAPKVINSWVADRTRGKIPRIVNDLQGTILLLANALWFKGLWSEPFDPAQTKDAEFTRADEVRVPCRMMFQEGTFGFVQNRHFQAICLPYGNRRIAFDILLPRPGVSRREVLRFLLSDARDDWSSQLFPRTVEIGLPRFRAEWGAPLNDVLASLGMGVAFTSLADFFGIGAGQLLISQVLHKVLLEVDEKGSEAAAATAVLLGRGLPPEPLRMIVDRPFACTIRDRMTGALLFAGWIAEPTAAGA